MPQGLQVFNEFGLNTVDLTDRHLTFLSEIELSFTGSSDTVDLTYAGIDPLTTVAFIKDSQVGSESNRLNRHTGLAVSVISVDRYRLSSVATLALGSPHTVVFYKFR